MNVSILHEKKYPKQNLLKNENKDNQLDTYK